MTLRHVIYAGDGPTPVGMLNYETLIANSAAIEDARRGGDALLGIFYTGGTTGFPKGVMLSHNNVSFSAMNSVSSGRCGVDTRFLHSMPMFHLADFAAMVALFITGGTHVVLQSFSPRAPWRRLTRKRSTRCCWLRP